MDTTELTPQAYLGWLRSKPQDMPLGIAEDQFHMLPWLETVPGAMVHESATEQYTPDMEEWLDGPGAEWMGEVNAEVTDQHGPHTVRVVDVALIVGEMIRDRGLR